MGVRPRSKRQVAAEGHSTVTDDRTPYRRTIGFRSRIIVLLGCATAAIAASVLLGAETLLGRGPAGSDSVPRATAVPRTAPCEADARRSRAIGRSTRGRRLIAVGAGCAGAPVRVLVVGSIHGDETAGHAIVRRLRAMSVPTGIELWTVRTVNPDGVALGTRQNARGVDLNRNFPRGWRPAGRPFDGYYPGPRPFSEPESRAVRDLVRVLHPAITVWYHQPLRLVDLGSGADARLVRAYARRTRLPARRIGFLPGVATRWQNQRFAGSNAFVVELPAGPLPQRAKLRHARAVLRIARHARRGKAGSRAGEAGRSEASSARPAATRPRIFPWRIPFGARRKREMRAYARRHYGIDDHRLREPKVIVLHLSVSDSARAVYETFAPDRPDPELGELPGVCAHFVIDPRGRIYQLVSLRLMCRHTVGLNHVSVGIEHVGRAEAGVFARKRQLGASLRLVRWLQGRHGILTRNVIGHNESLRSPYHRERVRRLRRQTHADFPPRFARRYRRSLDRGAASK